MFCSACGAQIADGSVFCPNCGSQTKAAPTQQYAPANDSLQQYQAQRGIVRQNEIHVLDNIAQYFSARQNQYDAYDEAAKKVNHFARGAKKGLIVWGAIIFFFSLIVIAIYTTENYYYDTSELFAFIGPMTIPGVLMIIGGILMQVANRKRFRNAQEEYHALANDLFHFYSTYPNCPIGYTYCHPRILKKLQDVLRTGRADTVKEGMNMMINQTSQRSIENYLQQLQKNAESNNVILDPDLFR